MRVLVTGGTGYIGSHAVVELIEVGHEVVIVDDLSNSKESVVDRIEAITGVRPGFHRVDIRDGKVVAAVLEDGFDAVMHFAGLKAVGESVTMPLAYYDVNVGGTVSLLEAMEANGVKTLVFSSSCTVYGDPAELPVTEDTPTSGATNPYGWTKLMIEQILADLWVADPEWRIARLRYFNPAGAHRSGLIGEDPNDVPNNLMPYIAKVAAGELDELPVFGDDYDTPDGTGVRDYIHVVDLARGHLAALDYLSRHAGVHTWNLGTGRGRSVLEMVAAFEAATGTRVPYRIVARRPGDVAATWADPSKAERELSWKAELDVTDMCADMWRWQTYATSRAL